MKTQKTFPKGTDIIAEKELTITIETKDREEKKTENDIIFNKTDAINMLNMYIRHCVEATEGKRFTPSLKPEYWINEYLEIITIETTDKEEKK